MKAQSYSISLRPLLMLLCGAILAGCGSGNSPQNTLNSPALESKSFSFGNLSGRAALTNPPLSASGRNVSSVGLTGQITALSLQGLSKTNANSRIAFCTRRDNALNAHIYTMLPDGSEETQFSGGAVNEIAWSPDGTKIAYYASSDIWVVKSTGGAPARLTNLTGVNTQPAWSPDGTKIAFISNRDGNNEIYVMNADGTGQTRLTLHVANDQAPAWSVSGNKIAFATNRDGNYEIYTMNTNGTSLTRLTNSIGDDLNPVYSPDGGSIAFTSTRDGGASEIYTMHYDGTQQRRLTNNSFSEASPTWSPDGAVLAYSSDRNSNTDIYALDLGSLIETRLTSHPEDDFKPAWSPFFTQRSLIGASMPLGSSASGVIYTGKGDDAASVVTFSVSDFTQVKMSLANAQETNGAWITYVVEGATNPISFAGFNLWNFSNIAPTPVTLPVGTNGALVQISATTGRVLYILPYTAPNRSANSSLKPAVVTQAGQRVLHGNFNGVYDAQGRNIAPNGAHEVRFDAQTGNLIYLQ